MSENDSTAPVQNLVQVLPKTPNEMPREFHNRENYYRNAFVGALQEFDSVEITFERDERDCDSLDDPEGTWRIDCSKGRRSFTAESKDFVKALWFVLEHSEAEDTREYEEWKNKRAAAASKLTADEKRLLGVRV